MKSGYWQKIGCSLKAKFTGEKFEIKESFA